MTSFKIYYVSPTHNARLWKPIDKKLDAFPQTGQEIGSTYLFPYGRDCLEVDNLLD